MNGYRQVLEDRLGRALFLSAAISQLGDWVGLAGLVVLAYQRTGSAVGSGAMFAVQGLAAVTASALIGPQLDRFDRARALRLTYVLGAAALLLPLVVDGTSVLLVTAALVGALRPLGAALRHALVGAELDDELIGPFVALQKVAGDSAVALGLATGGAIAATLGATLSLGLDAATFMVAAALAVQLPASRGSAEVERGILTGVRSWNTTPEMAFSITMILALATVSALPETLAPDVAGGSPWFPAVISAQAAGSALVAIVLGHRRDLERRRTLLVGGILVVVALALCAGAAAIHPALLALGNLLLGLALGTMVIAQTVFTRSAPKDVIGGAISSAITGVMLAEGLGSLALGFVAQRAGAEAAYLAAAGMVAAICAAVGARARVQGDNRVKSDVRVGV